MAKPDERRWQSQHPGPLVQALPAHPEQHLCATVSLQYCWREIKWGGKEPGPDGRNVETVDSKQISSDAHVPLHKNER